jgi:hypothetical protein
MSEEDTELLDLLTRLDRAEEDASNAKNFARMALVGVVGVTAITLLQGKMMLKLMQSVGQMGQYLQAMQPIPMPMSNNPPAVDHRPPVLDETIKDDIGPIAEPADPGEREAPMWIKESLAGLDESVNLKEPGID